MTLDMDHVLPILAFILQLIVVVIGGVWAISAIRSTTEKLSITIAHLSKAVDGLLKEIKEIDDRHQDHEVRLRLLEDRRSKGV